jgi:hypothetical protein
MKHLLLAIFMAAGLGLSAQKLPNPWDGLDTEVEQRELFGEPQKCWVIYGSNNEAFVSANTSIVKRGILSYFEDDGYGLVYIFDLGNKLRALEFWSHESYVKSRILFYYEE